MIQKTKSYTTSDGSNHRTLEAAREHELLSLVEVNLHWQGAYAADAAPQVCKFIMENADAIVDLVTGEPEEGGLGAAERRAALRPPTGSDATKEPAANL